MPDRFVPALECGHWPPAFRLEHIPGHGYQADCRDCQCKGDTSPIAGAAMASFDNAVRKARIHERKEQKRLAKLCGKDVSMEGWK